MRSPVAQPTRKEVRLTRRKNGSGSAWALVALAGWLVASATFAVQVPFDADTVVSDFGGANSISLADVNGDGNLDIVGVAEVDGQIAWWENLDGSGTIWIEHDVLSVPDTRSVIAADIDGDGDPDIVTGSYSLNTVAWLENDGTGLNWEPDVIDTDIAGPISIHADDIDGDGDTDVVAAGELADEIRWWENADGAGNTWLVRSVVEGFDGVFDVESADLDSDGDIDILSASKGTGEVVWWRNADGDGTVWGAGVVAALADATAVGSADVDSDGDLDLIAAGESSNTVNWYENVEGDGTVWAEVSVDADVSGPTAVLGFDLDRDGDIDVLASSMAGNEIVWWENTDIVGTEWSEQKVDTGLGGPADVQVGDIDKDGDPDVAAPLGVDNEIAWFDNETVHRQSVFPIENLVNDDVPGASVVVARDLDADGDLDLVAAASTGQDIRWWENGGLGETWTERIIDGGFNGALNVEVADVDGDGDLDVLGAAQTDDRLAWWENLLGDALTWVEHSIVSGFNGAFDVDAADIDGDGDLDVVGAAEVDDDITWFENLNGDGIAWASHTIDGNADGARSANAADFDGDGDLDVIGAMENANDITWWENFDGAGLNWITRTIEGGFTGADMVAGGDIDLDGDIDVVAAGIVADDIKWWENEDGLGTTWIERTIEGNFNGATSVVATDMDADGDIDILAAADVEDDIRWWENVQGDGLLWQGRVTDGNFDGASWAIVADINDDGKLDVVGAALNAGELAWWLNRGGQVSYVTANEAPSAMADGALDAILSVEIVHEGRPGDNDLELASMRVLFEEEVDDPLDSTEANNLFESVLIYADNGDEEFDEAEDTLVVTVNSLTLEGGETSIELPDDTPDLQVPFGAPKTVFLAVQLTADASLQDVTEFQITHLTEESVVEDADNDIPVENQLAAELRSRKVRASGTVPILDVTGICPGPVTITVSNATVAESVQIVQAREEGEFTLPFGRCAGVAFDLEQPDLLLTLIANIDGVAIAVTLLEPAQCEGFMQAQDGRRCLPSNVVQLPAPEPPE